MTKLDPRLNACRPDIADASLIGKVEAQRFVQPRLMQLAEPHVSLHSAPRFDAMQVTQALMGETVRLFDEKEGWAWVQLAADGYVGYVNGNALSARIVTPTHRVAVPATFIYPQPNLKSQPAIPLTLNAQLGVTGESGAFSQIADGRFVFTAHLKPSGAFESDFVSVAEMFRHVPYLWGGKSVHGLDLRLASPARYRHAGGKPRRKAGGEGSGPPQARRPCLLERPRRHHDGCRNAAPCHRPSHEGGRRAAEARS